MSRSPFLSKSAGSNTHLTLLPFLLIAQILPADPSAPGGGNPLQGLGRKDDPSPSRYHQYTQNHLQKIPRTEGDTTTEGFRETTTQTPDPSQTGSTSQSKIDGHNEGTTGSAEYPRQTQQPEQSTSESSETHSTEHPPTHEQMETTDHTTGDGIHKGTKTGEEGQNSTAGKEGFPNQTDTVHGAHPAGQPVDHVKMAKDMLNKALSGRHGAASRPADHLVPPPPATFPSSSPAPLTAERKALVLINRGHYQAAEHSLKQLLESDGNNMHARYLLAVALVHRKKYPEAEAAYTYIMQNCQDRKLAALAEVGLKKLKH